MKCPDCGQVMNDDAVFCISCGRRLSGNLPQSAPKKDKTPLIIGLGILAIVLIIGVACVLLLDPFGGKNSVDPYAYRDEEVNELLPESTEEPEETQPEKVMPEWPDDARPAGLAEGDYVGLPVPNAGTEVLQSAVEKYWEFLTASETAQEYALIDFLGDDLPEMIVRESREDGASCFGIYYLSGEKVKQIETEEISATDDAQLLSVNGTLMVRYNKEFINYVIVDQNLQATLKLVKTDKLPAYTDSALRAAASDRSLLDLHLLGKHEKFTGEGWIRADGTDYYYASGKPCTNRWVEEDGILYYLGDRACITQVANQSMMSDVLNAYFASYVTAFNQKDTSYLEHATDKNREEEAKWFQLEENKYLTISDLSCKVTLHKGNDADGSVEADVHLTYTQIGEWEQAKETSAAKDYRITLIWQDGQWYVDHIGNR